MKIKMQDVNSLSWGGKAFFKDEHGFFEIPDEALGELMHFGYLQQELLGEQGPIQMNFINQTEHRDLSIGGPEVELVPDSVGESTVVEEESPKEEPSVALEETTNAAASIEMEVQKSDEVQEAESQPVSPKKGKRKVVDASN